MQVALPSGQLTDHLSSVRLLVNTQTGAIAQRIDYDEFGRVLSDSQPGFNSKANARQESQSCV
ncbi:hypothetical protein [Nitrincola sp. MINF-07-Sa-05]|uniref:hypothetical protein n=1 Tax=Nitrincola salilacus TaxID=3400273 RepID=UPI0039180AEB